MRLWTIQSKDAFNKMQKTGLLRADEEHLLFDRDLKDSYLWMSDQMSKRIGPPPSGVRFPVWAWYQWEGIRKRPDMRHHCRGSNKEEEIVLLTIEVPDDQVLLSDFDYWHFVLNDCEMIYPFDFDKKYSEEEKKKSWEQIFDYQCTFEREEHNDLSTQATMWEIKKEWVIKVEHFKVR